MLELCILLYTLLHILLCTTVYNQYYYEILHFTMIDDYSCINCDALCVCFWYFLCI